MYRALYRKYRPASFGEVVGQQHITTTIKNQLKSGKIFHAYLFTGSRGTGKTSCAKILAKAVNCLSPKDGDACLECSACRAVENGENLDIVEIDAASNNGVDDIRDLKEQVSYTPAVGKYRVFIIDEVHMLSSGAFNALLKTLEEPPPHIIFILATTEVYKLPATILSRCQRFDFRRIDPDVICERIKYIAEKENIIIDDPAARLIASLADGGMRDALSILDLCAAENAPVTNELVESACGLAGKDYIFSLSDCIRELRLADAITLVDEIYRASVDMQRLCEELISHYRDLMIVKTVPSCKNLIICSEDHMTRLVCESEKSDLDFILFAIQIFSSALDRMTVTGRRAEVEMAIIKLCSAQSAPTSLPAFDKKPSPVSPVQSASPVTVKTPAASRSKKEDTAAAEDAPLDRWNEILRELAKKNPLMAGVLKGSRAYIKGDYLLIDSESGQFLDLMKSGTPLYRDSLREAAQSVLGKAYKLGPYHRVTTEQALEDPLIGVKNLLADLEVPPKL